MSTLWETFTDPPREFSPVPLWWWSGDTVTNQRLRWQLERLAAGGVFNVVVMNVAPTSPLYGKDADDPPFMSEPWWQLFEGVCRDADELGVRLWFYDQLGFSGANFQGQVVRAHPEHAGRWLERVQQERGCPAGGTPVTTTDGWLYYQVERGFDYFSHQGCRRLFAMVHGRFEERVGHLFGSVIAGSFQDELPNLPTWGPDFADRFEAIADYDPLPRLAALWEDGGEAGEGFRADYHAVRGRLAEEAFFEPLHEWHERHGLLCGVDQQYGGRDGQPGASSELYGDYARTHRWFSAPGSDHHGDAKIHSSLAHHYGRPRTWIEAFHTSGWGGTLEETFDWLLPWIGAGANLYNPHATYYSTRAGWWEWAPPATDWRQPYWRHYREFSRAVARLCAVLAWGDHSCDIGVLFPAATARAALRLDELGETGRRADALYREIVGSMVWHDEHPGVLNRLTRDFDILDDATVAGASAADGRLQTARETYATVVLPGCEVLEAATAARLIEFVNAGGTLIAVGGQPARAAGVRGDDAIVTELAAHFESGAACRVHTPDELGAILESAPRQVHAPVPTLLRRDGDAGVLFVPAVYPRASSIKTGESDDRFAWLRGVSYDFDRRRHAHAVDIVAAASGPAELWEPFSGTRRRVETEQTEDGLRVRIAFTDGPCALLAWGVEGDAEPQHPNPTHEITLDGEWDVLVETTLEDVWGDLDAPAPGLVETWELEQLVDGGWSPIHATFGPRATWRRAGAEWQTAEWSLARGIRKDPMHAEYLGPSGRVPEEFLDFGAVPAGESIDVRALVRCPAPLDVHLAIGASAAKQAWLDGRPVELTGGGYHASGPVHLPTGETLLELRLTATEPARSMRGHFAFVSDIEGYARPEWLRTRDASHKSSVVTFSTEVRLAAAATSANVIVGANGPCRLLVDGIEVGRQGGFDPYAEHDRDRLQPYDLAGYLDAGEHELRLELLDLGRTRPVALLDGVAYTATGDVVLRSDERWTASVDGRATVLDIRLDQRGDPAYNHAWRRPHPLPDGAWLEPGRAGAAAGGPLTVVAHTGTSEQRLRVAVPPGAELMRVSLAAGCRARAEIDGRLGAEASEELVIELDAGRPRHCELLIQGGPGLSGGALLAGPVEFTLRAGRMDLVDWQDAGLPNHSGAVRYRRRLEGAPAAAAVLLDLGDVRGTAEVLLDGKSVGVRVCAPFVFDLTGQLGPDGGDLEVVILNTLAPHLDAVSPTPYVFAGQRRSGLFGPVRVLT